MRLAGDVRFTGFEDQSIIPIRNLCTPVHNADFSQVHEKLLFEVSRPFRGHRVPSAKLSLKRYPGNLGALV